VSEDDLAGKVRELLDDEEMSAGRTHSRAAELVRMAERSAVETPARCRTHVHVNGIAIRCSKEAGHSATCAVRTPSAWGAPEVPAESDLGTLDDLFEWVPDPGPIRDEILEKLAVFPPLVELEEVAVLVGKLAALVDAS
jgi:hypothetical protein